MIGLNFFEKKLESNHRELTPCVFFLWSYLKSKIYIAKPRTLVYFKDTIEREIRAISYNTLESVIPNVAHKVDEKESR